MRAHTHTHTTFLKTLTFHISTRRQDERFLLKISYTKQENNRCCLYETRNSIITQKICTQDEYEKKVKELYEERQER